jgi:hypothetical protein
VGTTHHDLVRDPVQVLLVDGRSRDPRWGTRQDTEAAARLSLEDGLHGMEVQE